MRPTSTTAVRRPTSVIGYASLPEPDLTSPELERQADSIATACEERELTLIELVAEQEPRSRRHARPALDYALKCIEDGLASGLVIANVSRVADAAAQLG